MFSSSKFLSPWNFCTSRVMSPLLLPLRQRMCEISTAHSAEVESLSTQYKHQSQMLISDFNKAKAIFVNKISELEKQ